MDLAEHGSTGRGDTVVVRATAEEGALALYVTDMPGPGGTVIRLAKRLGP